MRVVPVIDLRRGLVVHGVAGQRDRYAPIPSVLTDTAEPVAVAQTLLELSSAGELYLADLDAIMEGRPQWDLWSAIQRTGARLWIDAGLGRVDAIDELLRTAAAQGLTDTPAVQWIVGLESVPDPEQLTRLATQLGPQRAIFSLDMNAGRLLAHQNARWPDDPVALAAQVVQAGFQHVILLDLAHVGRSEGVPIARLVAELASAYPAVRWTAGGGVRNYADLVRLAQAGCFAALVATALHRGSVTRADIERLSPASFRE